MNINQAWRSTVFQILDNGISSSPRGMETKELFHHQVQISARWPVLTVSARRLSYKFMAAEAFWILSGDDRVSTISPYNPNIGQFSDDGKTFFGAYGPRIRSQLDYVVNKLVEDPDSRQAGLTIWREVPPPTKDVPCTVALFFREISGPAQKRDGLSFLNTHVFMRSSDAWLGLPYDLFNFSMVAHLVCARLNLRRKNQVVAPGEVYLTMASSHLYERNYTEALRAAESNEDEPQYEPTPESTFTDEKSLFLHLAAARDARPGDAARRWWERT